MELVISESLLHFSRIKDRSVDEQHLALRKSYSSKTLFQQIAWRSLDNSRRQKNMLTGDYAEPLWAMVLDKKMEINHIPSNRQTLTSAADIILIPTQRSLAVHV
ncbi:hypothetical protein Smp_134600 [Schistosoma mansoni]|uniref:hypothetical protein n=1 Tax=Schistosoma mansoni TaxID=6183 RepID=UPI0001A64178|nr:hypothetical protein Smp_134600 [Schistosoma mansoni]|eukprot:XP_018653638.1 hypothetical protein Smp_134600 [Schistosoma mansoni]